MARELKPHGTPAAYQRHLKRGEKPCDACRQANTDRARSRYRTDPGNRAYRNAVHRARSKALTRLAERFPVEYLELVAEEMAREGLDTSRAEDRAWQAALATAEEEA